MKQTADVYTVDAFTKPGRGRPRKPDAKSNAQRQREFRQRRKFNFLAQGDDGISVTRNGK
ncbi:hypothetical protein [uncultured Oxalicibacterium sp.]|uniref:hypothetical protein n=1 Tax=uncultured Oxalicibacterium sp. TaxID=1168540 RepID=UPI0025F2C229|nr:hypothetical protein [uncultured Oxalicibacterium sp.]